MKHPVGELPVSSNMSFFQRMGRLLPSLPPTLLRPVQLALSLVLMIFSVLFAADFLGVGSDTQDAVRQARTSSAESLAVQLSVYASIGDSQSVDRALSRFVTFDEDVVAASLELADGSVIARHGDPEAFDENISLSAYAHLNLPILADSFQWGEVNIVYRAHGMLADKFQWFAFIGIVSFVSFLLFLGKVLNQLDPGRVVPARVETAFDLFSAGVVILDERLRIVLANKAAAEIVNSSTRELTGHKMDNWPWKEPENWQAPWATTLHSGLAVSDMQLRLSASDHSERIFSVSCAPEGSDTDSRGVLVTLDDLTVLEHRNRKLSDALRELQLSKEAISQKNEELEVLATTDPLTGIANRRTLMQQLEFDFANAKEAGTSLACIMSDIDHFKSVNDNYGHAVGDEVIKAVADILQRFCRETDTIGRYGGEEFVMILPGLDAQAAATVAERIRVGVIAAASGSRLAVPRLSSSFGVADLSWDPAGGSELVDAADQALYVAKQHGRNRVEIYTANSAESVDQDVSSEPDKPTIVQPSNEDIMMARIIELETQMGERDQYIKSLSEFDALTGVPMLTLFLQRVDTELIRASRSGTMVGVLSFELREVERIVSSFGHSATDALIVEFVERLQTGLRTTDVVSELTEEHSMSRITSNEYGVLLSDLVDSASAMIVVTRLRRLLSQPFCVGNEPVYVGANIGIALSGPDDNEAIALFRKASEARILSASKPDKVSHGFASAALNDVSHDYIRLESDLNRALDNNELEVWFQPKFDLTERRIPGMEALLRWQHETRGFVSPAVFIAVAEANGLIDRLSDFVLKQTISQINQWKSMGLDDLRISVNVSPVQLRAKTLVTDTLEALHTAGLTGECLEIELTETTVLDQSEEAQIALQELRSHGIHIAMDDFGAGYTSLALLADLPLDTVKIDRSFVSAMTDSKRNQSVVKSIITMAHALNLRVVGEGVETNEELEILSRFGCDEVQGYLISRPQSEEDITAFLVHQRASAQSRRSA